MHARAFPLTRTGPKRLLLTWDTGRRNLRVFFDGEQISGAGVGRPFRLPDGRQIGIDFNWLGQPRVSYNFRPLPGSADDPVSRIPIAAGVCFLYGFLWAIGGLYAILYPDPYSGVPRGTALRAGDFIEPLYLIYLIVGLVVIGCGVLIALRKRIGVWIALALIGIDTAIVVFGALQWLDGQILWSLALHSGALLLIYRAFSGFSTLQAEAAEALIESMRATRAPAASIPQTFTYTLPETTSTSQAQASPIVTPPPVSLMMSLPMPEVLQLRQIEACIQSNDQMQAKALLRDYMQRSPNNGYAWYLASLLLADKDNQISALRRALHYDPVLQAARDRLATLEFMG